MAEAAGRVGCAGSCRSPRWEPAARRGPAPVRSGLPTSPRRPPPRPTCAPRTWTGPSCAQAASPTPLPPTRSRSHPHRSPVARSHAPTSLRSLPPCSTNRKPGTRYLSWSAETRGHRGRAQHSLITAPGPHYPHLTLLAPRLMHTEVLLGMPHATSRQAQRRSAMPARLLLDSFPDGLAPGRGAQSG
jgi:hypothetical protein